ncbi:cytochrome c [Thiorhodococcus mannitoliphagus]|uniref:Cytochrome c n=1 Tax=Thiorhodococcus mannitoliphagus TaxID=329406 RepID=A0A6P1DXL8_9GAMM|nr:cytochrome c [Thiorhodococcus mannitoliphagus]NEX20872.1 cytochrome c [Thiorhodococcus mannitoliphagus]
MNTKPSFRIGLITLVVAGATTSARAATDDVEAIYQEHCTKCHGSEVYTRDDRKVTSYDGLVRQVQRCELSLQLTWFDDEIKNVADYLNTRFYHFKP